MNIIINRGIIVFVGSWKSGHLTFNYEDINTTKIILYYGPSFNNNEIIELDEAATILNNSNFDSLKKTTFYIHGYLENQDYESIRQIVKAYNRRGDQNLLVLDWAELADGEYLTDAIKNYKRLAPRITDVLLKMFNAGLNLDTFHLVGHSLGGQMAGFIGRDIIEKSEKSIKLPRISALDPAFPPFYFFGTLQAISSSDAQFVDVVHTDSWIYGAPRKGGHADFWPNSGKTLQPGCPKRNFKLLTDNDLCSHRHSWRFWAESVAGKFEKKFYAVSTSSWADFKMQHFNTPKSVVLMGIDCPTNATGDYYLTTNGSPPYARGLNGLKLL